MWETKGETGSDIQSEWAREAEGKRLKVSMGNIGQEQAAYGENRQQVAWVVTEGECRQHGVRAGDSR